MAGLLSVAVGLPRDVAWQDKTVDTGVWKTPVKGPRTVRRLNIDGNGQGDVAGHGGEHRALFVYQQDFYRYWQNALGRTDIACGQFGGNFTVDGLADTEVCIGDRYRIGGALFEVTRPRVTCYRVGIRMNEPASAGRSFRLGAEGYVCPQWPECLLGPRSKACSSWPRPATYRCAGRAEPESATTARPGSWRERLVIGRIRSMRRQTATS